MWSFVNNDISPAEFEGFVYSSEQLEKMLGKDRYLELLSAGYRDERDVIELKLSLSEWLQNLPRKCDCVTWKRNHIIPLCLETLDLFDAFDVLKKRNSWLALVRCKICRQPWYIATDTVDDDYHLLRVTEEQVIGILSLDKWPSVFNDRKNVWPNTSRI
jgi:hypothetical protein